MYTVDKEQIVYPQSHLPFKLRMRRSVDVLMKGYMLRLGCNF